MANDDNKGVNPAAAGVVGAVIGAAVAGAAVALSDKENRKKVGKAIEEIREEGTKRFTQLKNAADQVKTQAVAQIEKSKITKTKKITKAKAGTKSKKA